jgi:anti-sigma regulatory factor (Ser/Thr protein kinase)
VPVLPAIHAAQRLAAFPGRDEMKTGTALLGSLTFPGRPDRVAEARAFVAQVLGDDCPCTATAALLTSELVTNALQHSDSRRDGGTITVTLIAVPGGVRAEVIDEGAPTVPVLRADGPEDQHLLESGRGLQLVDMLSARWSYWRDEAGTVTWFELSELTP